MVLVSMRSFVNEDGRMCTCAGGMEPSSVSFVRLCPSSCTFVHLTSVCFFVPSIFCFLYTAENKHVWYVHVNVFHPEAVCIERTNQPAFLMLLPSQFALQVLPPCVWRERTS